MKTLNRVIFASILAALPLAAFSQVDTSGIGSWSQMYNSTASWEEGAFNVYSHGDYDYGWGIYNTLSHEVLGDSLYVVKLLDGNYKRLWIKKKKSMLNRYIFWYSDLDGSNEKKIDLAVNDYASKQFVNYSLSGDSLVSTQPESNSWDVVLTRFLQPLIGYYPVTGFMVNDGVSISVFHAPDSATAAVATLADTTEFTDSIAAIGNSWYTLEGYSIVPLDTLVFFIKQVSGDIYKLQITHFESGAFGGKGRVGIRKQRVSGIPEDNFTHDTLVMGTSYAGDVYFKMDNSIKYVVARANWEIGFKTNVFTASIWANTVSGVELYTYPNADTLAWGPAVSIDPVIASGTDISIYPLPARDNIFIRHQLNTQHPLYICVFDLTGKRMLDRIVENSGNQELQIDVSTLPEGLYILQINDSEKQAVSRFSISK